jgi:hypothetical protein
MTLQEARKTIEEIQQKWGINFSEIHEKRENGKIKMILVTLKFLVENKGDSPRPTKTGDSPDSTPLRGRKSGTVPA